jgi:hypothetical protein
MVEAIAAGEGIGLDPGIEATMGKDLTREGVEAVWECLLRGKSQQETALIIGVNRSVVSKIARRRSYRKIRGSSSIGPETGPKPSGLLDSHRTAA